MGVTDLRKLSQDLGPPVERLDHAEGGGWLIAGDVVVNAPQPLLGLGGPNYFRQDSIRRPISSCEMVRPASESASPRSTIAAKASSRTISSTELSSGWSWIRRMSCSFAGLMGRLYRSSGVQRTPRSAAKLHSGQASSAPHCWTAPRLLSRCCSLAK